MCAPFIPSWSFPSTVLKEMNTLPWLPRIFIGNWAAACYIWGLNTSCGWLYPATNSKSCSFIQFAAVSSPGGGFKLRLSRVMAAGYKIRLISSYDWLEFQRLETSCGWLHPMTDLAGYKFQLSQALEAGYKSTFRRLGSKCGWLIL